MVCFTGQLRIDLSRVMTESQVIETGLTARHFEDSKLEQYALNSRCTDQVYKSICNRIPFVHEQWNALDREYKPRTTQ